MEIFIMSRKNIVPLFFIYTLFTYSVYAVHSGTEVAIFGEFDLGRTSVLLDIGPGPTIPNLDLDAQELAEKFGITTDQALQLFDFIIDGQEDEFNSLVAELGINPSTSDAGTTPNSSAVRVTRDIFRKTIFQQAEPESQAKPEGQAGGPPGNRLGGDVFYNNWSVETPTGISDIDGETYGANISYAWGEETEFFITIPLYVTDIDNLKDEILTTGIDARAKRSINDNFAVGAHFNYLNVFNDNISDDVDISINMGPFASANFELTDQLDITVGCLVDYVQPEDVGENWLAAFGANLGINVTDNVALNPYIIYYNNFDQSDLADSIGL